MTKSNKVISFVLSVSILLSAFVLLPITKVNAVSQTREEAVNWANSQIGKYINADGVYGNQCVDLIMAYYEYLGVSRVSGHGYQYATNALPSGWTRIQNTPTFVPEPGDIVVWNTSIGGGYGHVAIFISGDTSSFVSIDQNWPKGTSCQKVTHNYNSVWGVVRPNFSASVPPSNPTISKNQVWYDLQDTIEITAYADNATSYWMALCYKGGDRIATLEVPGGKLTVPANQYGVGDYSVYFSCCNDVGYVDTSWLDFSVVGPATYNDIWTSKDAYDIDETISITVDSVCAKGQYIGIDRIGAGRVYEQDCKDRTFTISASTLGIGTYSAYFSVYNGSGGVDTKRVSFVVAERKNLGEKFCAYIEHKNSQMYLTGQGDKITGHEINGRASQKWNFTRMDNGAYIISNLDNGKYMDVWGSGTNDNTVVHLYDECTYEKNQQFFIYEINGSYYFKPLHTEKVLDMKEIPDYDLTIWTQRNEHTPQMFDIIKLNINEALPVDMGENFSAYIQHENTGMYLTGEDDKVFGQELHNGDSQKWDFARMDNGAYIISNLDNGKYMDVWGSGTNDNTVVHLYDECTYEKNQQFFIYEINGSYYFKPLHTDKVLDMKEIPDYDLTIWTQSNEHTPQMFEIVEIPLLPDVVCGDVNNDSIVNMKDIVLLQQYLNNWDVTINTKASDVNSDDVINMKDIVLLQQYMNGWGVTLQ